MPVMLLITVIVIVHIKISVKAFWQQHGVCAQRHLETLWEVEGRLKFVYTIKMIQNAYLVFSHKKPLFRVQFKIAILKKFSS